jgi:hypothetical protein
MELVFVNRLGSESKGGVHLLFRNLTTPSSKLNRLNGYILPVVLLIISSILVKINIPVSILCAILALKSLLSLRYNSPLEG